MNTEIDKKKAEWTVIKLGGSILIPDLPDTQYLREFRSLIRERVKMGEKFLIIVGGGKTCRNYQETLAALSDVEEVAQDWIGIQSGIFNGHLVRLAFGDEAFGDVVLRPSDLPDEINESVVICGAEAPGHSFNYDGVVFAEKVGAKTLLNLSNIDYVYSADPRKDPTAEKYEQVSWEKYLTFIPSKWTPGMPTPFDPAASHEAQKYDIDVVFMKGSPISNLKNYFETGEVNGSVISNKFA